MTETSADAGPRPTSPFVPAATARLSITFRGLGPSEEVVYFVRRCAMRLPSVRGLEVTIEQRSGRHRVRIRDRQSGRALVVHDTDVLLGVRDAFDMWEATAAQ